MPGHQRSNISQEEQRALRSLNNKNIVTLAADKGNAGVILDASDYTQEIRDLLDPVTCNKHSRDPTAKILEKRTR